MQPIGKSRPVSAHTFGAPETILRAPTPHRANSATRTAMLDVDTRPTLVRSQTPQPSREEQQDIARMFSENMFADPQPQRAYGKFGPKLLTDGHTRLMYILREECGRLFNFNKALKEKLASADKIMRTQAETIAELRSISSGRADRLSVVNAELRDAHDALQEMDELFAETRNKRRSRIGRDFDTLNLREQVN